MPAHDTGASPHVASRDATMLRKDAQPASSASGRTTNEHLPSTPGREQVGRVTMTPLLTPDEVSRLLGIPPGTLANWRYQGHGPAFVRLGRHVRYRACDVDEWVESRLARVTD